MTTESAICEPRFITSEDRWFGSDNSSFCLAERGDFGEHSFFYFPHQGRYAWKITDKGFIFNDVFLDKSKLPRLYQFMARFALQAGVQCRDLGNNCFTFSALPTHDFVVVNYRGNMVEIDAAIEPFISLLWSQGFSTLHSCEGGLRATDETIQPAYVSFPAEELDKVRGLYHHIPVAYHPLLEEPSEPPYTRAVLRFDRAYLDNFPETTCSAIRFDRENSHSGVIVVTESGTFA